MRKWREGRDLPDCGVPIGRERGVHHAFSKNSCAGETPLYFTAGAKFARLGNERKKTGRSFFFCASLSLSYINTMAIVSLLILPLGSLSGLPARSLAPKQPSSHAIPSHSCRLSRVVLSLEEWRTEALRLFCKGVVLGRLRSCVDEAEEEEEEQE